MSRSDADDRRACPPQAGDPLAVAGPGKVHAFGVRACADGSSLRSLRSLA